MIKRKLELFDSYSFLLSLFIFFGFFIALSIFLRMNSEADRIAEEAKKEETKQVEVAKKQEIRNEETLSPLGEEIDEVEALINEREDTEQPPEIDIAEKETPVVKNTDPIPHDGDTEVLFARFDRSGATWTVAVTLKHDDSGWDHYADQWRVIDENGSVLGTRVLLHPHETEQPFTRNQSGINIPENITHIFIDAHDTVHGWSADKLVVDLTQESGDRYKIHH